MYGFLTYGYQKNKAFQRFFEFLNKITIKIVSEYDQEIPQS